MFTCPLIINSLQYRICWVVYIFAHSTLWFLYSLNRNWKYMLRRLLLEKCKRVNFPHSRGSTELRVGRYLKKNKVVILSWRCATALSQSAKTIVPYCLNRTKYHSVTWVGISSTATHTALYLCLLICSEYMQMWCTIITHRMFGWYHLNI